LFRRHGGRPERTEARIEEFLRLLRSAIGMPAADPLAKSVPRSSKPARR
jgi:hypothetical protein